MWPLPPPAPNGAPVGSIDLIQELPWGPYGPGIPIGFSNRFSGHCTCKCPCPCVCPILNQETTGHLNPYNTTPWTADLSGGSNNSIRKDCYCLCTCPCPGSFVAPIAPPVSAGSNVPGVNPIPHFPTYPQVPPKPHDTLLFDLLNELLRGHMLIREDISQMRLSFKADLDEMRHLILEQTGQSFEYILQVMQTNNDSHIKFVTEKWKILESMYSELRIEAERVAVTLEVLYVNFIQFHTEFREILANNNLSSDRLSGYPPIATRPPSYSSGHQLPDFGSPGPSHHGYSPKTGGKKADSLGLQPPPGSRPENSPDGETNRTDAADLEPKSRMLPVRLDDHQRVPNPAGSRAVEGGRKDLSSEGCIIIADCFGIAGPWSPLFIAMRAPYSDGEVALQGNEEPLGVLKNRWGIWNTMASPGRRMHSNGLFTLHDFFQQHIDDQLMSIFQTSKRRPGRNRRKRRRRPRPYRYPQRPLIPGLHYIRPPVMQSSIISAVGSPDGMLIHKLPWIPSESLEHLPPRITMPRIDNLPYSMSYIDERGNSVNININRRNNPVAGKPRAARSSEGENPNLRRCLMGEK
ncbi:uncharacterized protein [Venturia canescens]|uniref:uncharacterized protein n=1 Tax=Venturia canescens TaxID=32260 RepID=UPI001C9C0AF0|nr:uncharacterized protein LOC122418448 [Venturia canescens]